MRPFRAAFIAALLIARGGAAQERAHVSEGEFLASIDDEHPAIAALREPLGAALASELRARTFAAPSLELTREAPSGSTRQLDVTVRWQPPRPGARSAAVDAASAGVDAARTRLSSDRTHLLESARDTFARWAVSEARLGIETRRAAVLDALYERERRRAESGESAGLVARRVAMQSARARTDLARAEAERIAASSEARAWRPDLPADAFPELPPLPVAPPMPDAPHPAVIALRRDLDQTRATERLAGKVARMPAIIGGWQRQEIDGLTFDGPIVGLEWPLPLLDRGRADRALAESTAAALESQLTVLERQTNAARESGLRSFEELSRAAKAARATVGDGDSTVAAANAAFVAGEADLTDLLDTLRSATEAEVDALELHAEALAAHRRLMLAAQSSASDGTSGQGDAR